MLRCPAAAIAVLQMLVQPLDRIFYSIRTNAAQVVAALGPPAEVRLNSALAACWLAYGLDLFEWCGAVGSTPGLGVLAVQHIDVHEWTKCINCKLRFFCRMRAGSGRAHPGLAPARRTISTSSPSKQARACGVSSRADNSISCSFRGQASSKRSLKAPSWQQQQFRQMWCCEGKFRAGRVQRQFVIALR